MKVCLAILSINWKQSLHRRRGTKVVVNQIWRECGLHKILCFMIRFAVLKVKEDVPLELLPEFCIFNG